MWRYYQHMPSLRAKKSSPGSRKKPAKPASSPPNAASAALGAALGVTPLAAAKLATLSIQRRFDLVLHLPLRYEDETKLTPVEQAPTGVAVQVEVVVIEATIQYRPRRQIVVRARDTLDGEAPLVLRFVNFYGSQSKHFTPGARIRALGEIRDGFFGAEIVHPHYRVVEEGTPLAAALTPVYPTTAGLTQPVLRRAIDHALASEPLDDTLPMTILEEAHQISFSEAITKAHRPLPEDDADALVEGSHPAWQRIKFDELLTQQMSLKRAYETRRTRTAPAMRAPRGDAPALVPHLLEGLPFALTGAQARVWREIERDLATPHPMQRLLQGDVGSGKTIVAALAACRAVEAGYQAAFMAPTEILAEQHFRKLTGWLAPLGVTVAWLTGSLKAKERRTMAAMIASGEAQIAVGTHALFQADVEFANLGLTVVDEQHRFGVKQRLALRLKGSISKNGSALDSSNNDSSRSAPDMAFQPHQLMMSATPIPRTLAMTFFADLDVSVIDELPAGRPPIITKLVADSRRDEIIGRVREAALAGAQAYWVCPLIEESEMLQLQTAVDTHAALQAALPELQVALLHGRMKSAEKTAVMDAFASGETHLLVSTTVIEVGVDVPNASLMVIEHAERFGLSQLHQLRGRVGRDSRPNARASYCVLLYQGPVGFTARQRLKIMFQTTDGFLIAREDLKIRGPGEFLGARQSGVPMLRFANLEEDAALVETAREVATKLLRDQPDVAQRHLDRWLGGRDELLRS